METSGPKISLCSFPAYARLISVLPEEMVKGLTGDELIYEASNYIEKLQGLVRHVSERNEFLQDCIETRQNVDCGDEDYDQMHKDRNKSLNAAYEIFDRNRRKAVAPAPKTERITPEALNVLERAIRENKHPTKSERERLADKCGLSEKRVQNWFRNRNSARHKNTKNAKAKEAVPKEEGGEVMADKDGGIENGSGEGDENGDIEMGGL